MPITSGDLYNFQENTSLPEGQPALFHNSTSPLTLEKTISPDVIYSCDCVEGQGATVTVRVKNTSSTTAPNVFFQDNIDPRLQFVAGSVLVNGCGECGCDCTSDPNVGFCLGDIAPNEVKVITFNVSITTCCPMPIPNIACATYNGCGCGGGQDTVCSNTATISIVINCAKVIIKKTVDKASASAGDIITYTLNLKNTGNVTATGIMITDTIPSGTSFIAGSVTGASGMPPSLTVIAPLEPEQTAVVTFKVLVGDTMPAVNPIQNSASVVYKFTIDPARPNGGTGTGNSNTVTTLVKKAVLLTTKSVDVTYGELGQVLTYTITITNSGSVAAEAVTITDTVPNGTTFVAGSVTGATGTPPTLTLLAPIPAGGTATVTFKVKIWESMSVPSPIVNTATVKFTYTIDPANPNGESGNSVSNTVKTLVNTGKLVMKKKVDKIVGYLNDILTYQISATNMGDVPLNNVIITDSAPNGTVIVPGSVNVSVPYTMLLGGGIKLDMPVAPGQTVAIAFKVLVVSMPTPNPIINCAFASYTYTLDVNNPDGASGVAKTNCVATLVFRNNFSQEINEIIQSIALEQAALAALINAEGAKIQRMAGMKNIEPQQLICLNKSVEEMLEAITLLETVLKQKIAIVSCQIDGRIC